MKLAIRSLPGLVAFCVGVLAVSSCGRTSSVSPTAPSLATDGTSRALSKFAATSQNSLSFALLAGSVVIENAKGDRIAGTYSGTTVVAIGGAQASSLTLQVSDGSGRFRSASGTIAIQGVGAFADEGQFSLEGRGELTLAGGRRAAVVFSLRGLSRATCSSSERVAITQTADGTMARAGRVTATLTHEVGGTSCSS